MLLHSGCLLIRKACILLPRASASQGCALAAPCLTAREALAQVQRATPARRPHPATAPKHAIAPQTQTQTIASGSVADGMVIEEQPKDPSNTIYTYAQQMPTFRGGDVAALTAYLQQQVRWPTSSGLADAAGRVFVSFIVGKNGVVRDTKVVKGVHPLLDTEALRVVRELPALTPGKQNGQAVAVSLTVLVIFIRN